jgi:hypothetical protein
MVDAHANFAYSTLTAGIGTGDTSLTVQTGDGTLFPATPFNATLWPTGVQPTRGDASGNAEIITVNTRSGDSFTSITRAQEGTTAKSFSSGAQIAATITKKTLTDVEDVLATTNVTLLSYQNRIVGASTQYYNTANNSVLWLNPFRVPRGQYVSASTLLFMQSFSGTATSNQTNTWAQTLDWVIYSNNTTNSTRFDSWISSQITMNVWNSGTASVSYAYNGTTSSSAATNLLTFFHGLRMHTFNIGSTVPPGAYVFGFHTSFASTNASSIMRSFGMVMDNPVPLGMGTIGAGTNVSSGYVDAGTYSASTAGIPSSIGLTQISASSNLNPYFKMGAI